MALILFIVAVACLVVWISDAKRKKVTLLIMLALCAIAIILLMIANSIPRDITISRTYIPINNTDNFCITYDSTNTYVCFEDGYDNHYVIPKEIVRIETFSDSELKTITVSKLEVNSTNSWTTGFLGNLNAFLGTHRDVFYEFLIPESANKLQETTEPNE